MTKEIYLFSGLGADERAFQKLDFTGFQVNHISWIDPKEHEPLELYAARLKDQIRTPNPILVGLSFGGMVAIEVAKQIQTEKIILLSSAKTKSEIPFYFRFAGRLRLQRLIPVRFFKRSNAITNWFFGAESVFEKDLLKQILHDTDPRFLKWSLDKITRWSNETIPPNTFHIHGSKDRILPIRFVRGHIPINHGGHLMVLNRSAEINALLKELL